MSNNLNQAIPVSPGPEVAMDKRWTAVEEYRNRVKSAKRDLAHHIEIAFEVLDTLDEAEFMDVIKMCDNGASACDFLEKFRKWKGL